MDNIAGFAISVMLYCGYWIAFRKRKAVDFLCAARYWISPGVERRQGSAEDRVLRYLSEVYGSGIDLPQADRLLAFFGVIGCLAALAILLNGVCSLYLSLPHFARYWTGRLELVMFIGIVPPSLVMVFGKWRKTVHQRQLGAIRRIFGNLDRAATVASGLRDKFPDASDLPTTWAFPIHPDYAVFESGKTFLFAYVFLVLSSIYAAQTVPRFVVTAILALSIFFVPVVLQGMLASFGGWTRKRDEIMAYPVSVFMRDIRILEKQRKLLSFG